jgi:hypothetical protein
MLILQCHATPPLQSGAPNTEGHLIPIDALARARYFLDMSFTLANAPCRLYLYFLAVRNTFAST